MKDEGVGITVAIHYNTIDTDIFRIDGVYYGK